MSYLTTFNNLIEEFINKLSDLYPEDQDFKNFKTILLIIKKANPRKILELFDKHCLKYKEYIKNKDEQFILTYDFIKDKHELEKKEYKNNVNDEYIISLMIKLRDYWAHMDKDTIDNIWKYLNLFILLSDKLKQ